jgi:hypothetical protein
MIKYRLDLVLSYWIFIWYLIYFFGYIKADPKLALFLALILNVIMIIYRIFISRITLIRLIIFIVIQIIIKIIPLYTLRNVKINFVEDIKGVILLTLLYLIWVYINKETALELYKNNYSPLTDFIINLSN